MRFFGYLRENGIEGRKVLEKFVGAMWENDRGSAKVRGRSMFHNAANRVGTVHGWEMYWKSLNPNLQRDDFIPMIDEGPS